MPKKKPNLAVDRIAKYAKGKSREDLRARLAELAPLMPADDNPEIFTEFFDIKAILG